MTMKAKLQHMFPQKVGHIIFVKKNVLGHQEKDVVYVLQGFNNE